MPETLTTIGCEPRSPKSFDDYQALAEKIFSQARLTDQDGMECLDSDGKVQKDMVRYKYINKMANILFDAFHPSCLASESAARELREENEKLRSQLAVVLGQQTMLHHLDMNASNDRFSGEATLSHPMVLLMAVECVQLFNQTPGAINFLSWRVTTPDCSDTFEIIVQRVDGKRPAEMVTELKASADKAESECATLRQELAISDASLRDAISNLMAVTNDECPCDYGYTNPIREEVCQCSKFCLSGDFSPVKEECWEKVLKRINTDQLETQAAAEMEKEAADGQD